MFENSGKSAEFCQIMKCYEELKVLGLELCKSWNPKWEKPRNNPQNEKVRKRVNLVSLENAAKGGFTCKIGFVKAESCSAKV